MKRIFFCLPLLAIAVCTVATAEPRVSAVRTASLAVVENTQAPVSLVGFFHAHRGGYGYGPSCGFEPSCGLEATCAAEPSCGCGDDLWGGYCAPRHRHHRGLFHHHRRHNCGYAVDCGCEVAGPSCGADIGPACGVDAGPACGCRVGHCRRHHFGHRLCGCGWGCNACGNPHCGPVRFWANGWCGQIVDGWNAGNPPPCVGDAVAHPIEPEMAPGKALPPEPTPMQDIGPEPALEAAPAPAKSTRRPVFAPRFVK